MRPTASQATSEQSLLDDYTKQQKCHERIVDFANKAVANLHEFKVITKHEGENRYYESSHVRVLSARAGSYRWLDRLEEAIADYAVIDRLAVYGAGMKGVRAEALLAGAEVGTVAIARGDVLVVGRDLLVVVVVIGG